MHGITCAAAVAVYIRMGVCNLCYAFCNSPWPQCSIRELVFSEAEIRSFSKAKSRLSATWSTSLLHLVLVYIYRVAIHSSIYKTILIIIIYTAQRVCTSMLSFIILS